MPRKTSSGTKLIWDPEFFLSDNLVADDYSSVFGAQLTKFGPGGRSSPHSHTYNHAFYFLTGTAA